MKTTMQSGFRGFTRIEFIALVGTFLLLTLILVPSAANSRGYSRAGLCLANHRHLILAWQLYTADHNGILVGNCEGGEAQGGSPARLFQYPWATGWLDWSTSRHNTNNNFIRDRRFAKLADYFTTHRNVHRCPVDTMRTDTQAALGIIRVRSVAMNATLGATDRGTVLPEGYRQALTESAIYLPSPAETSVFLDEHPNSINDPMFRPPGNGWVDLPGNLHSGGGSVSFADGHVGIRSWRTSGIRNYNDRFTSRFPPAEPNDPDIAWLRNSSQRK